MSDKWFHRGATAFQRVTRATFPYGYVCPECTHLFTPEQIDGLTLEHAPPDSMGGNAVCLTCWRCNNRAGHVLDPHAVEYENLIDFAAGTMPKLIPAYLSVGGHRTRIELQAAGNGILAFGIPKANNPETTAAQMDAFAAESKSRSEDLNIQVEFGRAHSRKAYLSRLRSAYLIAFASFGYRYVIHPRLKQVRTQLANVEDETIMPLFSVTNPEGPRDEFTICRINEPAWMRSVAVQLGRHVVYLPDPYSDTTPYEEMLSRSQASSRLEVRTVVTFLPWPQEPMHAWD